MRIITENKKAKRVESKDETVHTLWIENGENNYRIKTVNGSLQICKLSAGSIKIEIINDFIALK